MADTDKGRDYRDPAQAAHELGAPTANTIDAALGPNWEAWTQHVQATVQLPDEDDDGWVEPADVVVPILQYGDGPHDYIATDIDAGQVMVRDGNDSTGRAWKFPLRSFYRFLAHAQGKKLPGDDEEAAKGDGMYQAAAKLNERTARLVEADREATEATTRDGKVRHADETAAAARASTPGDTKRTGK